MCTGTRIDENPALDVARFLALELNLPLLIYQGLSERYDYASDRHHAFILEGARDVQLEVEAAGLCYAVHLERTQNRQPQLISLAKQAAVVITEDMPVRNAHIHQADSYPPFFAIVTHRSCWSTLPALHP